MCREGAWTELTVSVTAGLSIPGEVLGFFMEKNYVGGKLIYQVYNFQFYGMGVRVHLLRH